MRRRLLPIAVLCCLSLLAFPLRALLAGRLFLPLTLRAVSSSVPTVAPEPTIPLMHVIEGTVYDADRGMGAPISGAVVSIVDCVQQGATVWSTSTDAQGRYTLSLARQQLDVCNWVVLQVTAADYEPAQRSIRVATLYAQPVQHVGMQPMQVLPTVPATVPATLPAPTPTQMGSSLVLAGRVYDAGEGLGSGIHGAAVQVSGEGTQWPLSAATNAQGDYSLVIPADYCPGCQFLLIRVVAIGYTGRSETVPVATLRAQPLRDYALGVQEGQTMHKRGIE